MSTIDPGVFREVLVAQRRTRMKGGLYHFNQIDMAFNSNRIEGSTLTHDQTRSIFETRAVDGMASVDDITETSNHFRMFDWMLDHLDDPLTIEKVQHYHALLKAGTRDAEQPWFVVGGWKRLANEVGQATTTRPDKVQAAMTRLLGDAARTRLSTLEEIAAFHVRFETIHPFQDGNGRVGRMVMFEQALNAGIVPFIVLDVHRSFYLRGLSNFAEEKGWLLDTLRTEQDIYLDRFGPMVSPEAAVMAEEKSVETIRQVMRGLPVAPVLGTSGGTMGRAWRGPDESWRQPGYGR